MRGSSFFAQTAPVRVVADVVVPTADYVRLAGHYGFAPDFCHANDPQSKGIVEHLCGYAQRDLAVRC